MIDIAIDFFAKNAKLLKIFTFTNFLQWATVYQLRIASLVSLDVGELGKNRL